MDAFGPLRRPVDPAAAGDLLRRFRLDVSEASAREEWEVTRDFPPDDGEHWLRCLTGEVVSCAARQQPQERPREVHGYLYRDGVRQEAWLPTAGLAPAEDYWFYARLFRKAPEDTLGISNSMSANGRYLTVEAVAEGLVDIWNQGCLLTFPRDAIRSGDRIVQVNKVLGSAEGLRAELKTARSLRISLVRPSLESRSPAGVAAWTRAALGD
mmetsp:Transcript_72020/g.188752  ORF Transcript_72020/g.188752 Transcript_72020/m.188752 type:complete len:211 (-) Transcript_72020:49-681(-)